MFDEWAADQDPLFKEVFYREILPELRTMGKAVLVISHDDRYFHLADQLVRMENGCLTFNSREHVKDSTVSRKESKPAKDSAGATSPVAFNSAV
jgi:putative ATP-binding cassette transporter